MDFKQLATSETSICKIKDAKGKATEIWIELYGSHTKHFREVAKKYAGDNEGLLAALTKNWGGIDDGVEALSCDFDTAKMVYTESAIIGGQVDAHLVNINNFLPKASKD